MNENNRELTDREKRSIRKLVTMRCANYDSEYGCLPLDSACYMLGICYASSKPCWYFQKITAHHQ